MDMITTLIYLKGNDMHTFELCSHIPFHMKTKNTIETQ